MLHCLFTIAEIAVVVALTLWVIQGIRHDWTAIHIGDGQFLSSRHWRERHAYGQQVARAMVEAIPRDVDPHSVINISQALPASNTEHPVSQLLEFPGRVHAVLEAAFRSLKGAIDANTPNAPSRTSEAALLSELYSWVHGDPHEIQMLHRNLMNVLGSMNAELADEYMKIYIAFRRGVQMQKYITELVQERGLLDLVREGGLLSRYGSTTAAGMAGMKVDAAREWTAANQDLFPFDAFKETQGALFQGHPLIPVPTHVQIYRDQIRLKFANVTQSAQEGGHQTRYEYLNREEAVTLTKQLARALGLRVNP
jgi:hypothetical protein